MAAVQDLARDDHAASRSRIAAPGCAPQTTKSAAGRARLIDSQPVVSEPDKPPDAEPEPAATDESGRTGLLDELLADPVPTRESGTPITQPITPLGTRVGRLVEWTFGHPPKVELEGNDRGPLPARSVIPLDPATITEAIASARGVLLTFEDGRPDAPIITGLLQDFADFGEAPQSPPEIWDEAESTEQDAEQPESNLAEVEARVDGKRIELEAADEIVLKCGQASIVLRRNGRVVIRGTYVESRSRGVNRIKGGSVEIN
jgi:hypothetical protein